MKKLSLETLIDSVEDMPILPARINKILQLTEDPDSTVQDVELEILKDQSLTTKVLRLANSTYYGYARKITTVSEATVLLGFQAIKSITLASAVSQFLITELPGGYRMEKYDLWNQSQTCAIISRHIAKEIKYPKPDEAYIAGLLRDIGKTILNYYVAKEYENILNKVENEGVSFLDAEEEILGFNHGDVGSKVAEKWNFPKELVESIQYHHTPEKSQANNSKLVSIVHIADAITMMMGVGLGTDGLAYNFSEFALKTLNLSQQDIEKFFASSMDFLYDEESFNI
ncbi:MULTISPECIES: HDOD domain-containing protein [Clostridium]|jgi:putative nucleotidyltransferase with HDIG domain|uniref:HDIG domain-containing protein n=2 Tax=Clostridium cochlearium TaxID=1494 RepID=A0A240ACN6_CLOCO|nr:MULTISPECIES: HDOD domain-containing protein [Clostridium]MBV1820670.1 HDOD domain-containing protein [Bacteroidales bacterium MSK.15.36]NSJ91835.1 HDOD domain-containing protein [Coprococcus sp. MSK.21.13]MBE6043148.1 HDOD domain-containing protein [Clostridium thermopalmarium]MBE6065243.1 HDOD domain-containing protein [Clostridium cochlearium]MBU5269095.1 HDOD domain-containing protein [Clostridium cochlearium]